MSEITLDKVTKRFPDGTEAVKELDLEIADGEFLILVGPSGCGKSTALRMIAGLEDISDGELKIGDKTSSTARRPKDRDIAMVFQNYALYPHMTVRENMAFPLKMAKARRSRRSTRRSTTRRRSSTSTEHLDRKPGEPLRRAAPAGRDGPGDRARAEGLPDGRAALEPRREAARPDARRGLADPEPARDDDRLRHPRPDRGDDARRPGRGDAQGRAPAGRQPAGALRRAGQPVRRRLHRLTGDELHAGRDLGRHGEAAVRRGRAAATRPGRRSTATRGDEPDGRDPARALRGRLAGRRSGRARRSRSRSTILESMGSELYVYFDIEAERLPLRAARRARRRHRRRGRLGGCRHARSSPASTRPARPTRGERIELWMDPARLHFFDLDSGERISASPRAGGR